MRISIVPCEAFRQPLSHFSIEMKVHTCIITTTAYLLKQRPKCNNMWLLSGSLTFCAVSLETEIDKHVGLGPYSPDAPRPLLSPFVSRYNLWGPRHFAKFPDGPHTYILNPLAAEFSFKV
jgi:hypothetical protein